MISAAPCPCNPSAPGPICGLCSRRIDRMPAYKHRLHTIVIDVSALMPASKCALFAPRVPERIAA